MTLNNFLIQEIHFSFVKKKAHYSKKKNLTNFIVCFITKEGIPHTWDIPSLFKSMLIILITNNECSLFRKGISICKLASNEWTVAYLSYFNFIVSFNTVNVLMYAFLTWIFRKRKYSPYAETEYWHDLLLLVEKQI